MKAKATHATHFKSGPRSVQETTKVKREKPAYLFSGSNRIIIGSRNFSCGWGFASQKGGHQNVWRDRNRSFGHKERLSDGNEEMKTKKGGSVATSRGMNAKQGDYKCGGRINTLPNIHGYYDGYV